MSLRPEDPLLYGGVTDRGRVRDENEDALARIRHGDRTVLVVADGMGGSAGGRVASRLAVETIGRILEQGAGSEPAALLRRAFEEAHRVIRTKQAEDPALSEMGSTSVAVIVEGYRCWYAHIGDSRAYWLRHDRIQRLTKDHTLVQRMVDGGLVSEKTANEHPNRNVIYRALGRDEHAMPDVCDGPIELDNREAVVLTSDGATDLVLDAELAEIIFRHGPANGAKRIIELANARGGHDNATVQVLYRGCPRRSWGLRAVAHLDRRAIRRVVAVSTSIAVLGALSIAVIVDSRVNVQSPPTELVHPQLNAVPPAQQTPVEASKSPPAVGSAWGTALWGDAERLPGERPAQARASSPAGGAVTKTRTDKQSATPRTESSVAALRTPVVHPDEDRPPEGAIREAVARALASLSEFNAARATSRREPEAAAAASAESALAVLDSEMETIRAHAPENWESEPSLAVPMAEAAETRSRLTHVLQEWRLQQEQAQEAERAATEEREGRWRAELQKARKELAAGFPWKAIAVCERLLEDPSLSEEQRRETVDLRAIAQRDYNRLFPNAAGSVR